MSIFVIADLHLSFKNPKPMDIFGDNWTKHEEKIKKDIFRAKTLSADLIVVCLHWGDEYQLLPNKRQEDLADFLVKEGVQLIIGAHPHVIQPMELRYDEQGNPCALIVYSLGNFISNMKTRDTVGGAMVKVVIRRDITGKILLQSAQHTLVYTRRPTIQKENFRVVPAIQELKEHPHRPHLKGFVEKAHEISSKYNKGVTEYQIEPVNPTFK